jgi:protein-tyrosine-phosphatase
MPVESAMPYNVLFLCTGNSARSVLAEALLNARGRGRFRAFSAGSRPKGQVHPMALETLERKGLATGGLRSKSWHEFSAPNAPHLDFIFTVCGNAAREECPHWPGRPVTAHWGVDDPAAVEGPEQAAALERAFRELDARITRFLEVPIEGLDPATLVERLRAIGRTD